MNKKYSYTDNMSQSEIITLPKDLPAEVLSNVFEYLNVEDISRASCVCKYWNNVINGTDFAWRKRCEQEISMDTEDILSDRKQGCSWKATFQRNYGSNRIKRQWKKGKFSKCQAYKDLPPKVMCKLDAEGWGEVLQRELER